MKHVCVHRLNVFTIFQLVDSFISKSRVFLQDGLVGKILLVIDIELRVKKLASVSVGAVGCSVKLNTNFGLKIVG